MDARSRQLRGKLANASRHRPDEDHTELRRDLKASRLEEYIRRTVDEAPPLTYEQRERLAQLLHPAPAAAAAAGGGPDAA